MSGALWAGMGAALLSASLLLAASPATAADKAGAKAGAKAAPIKAATRAAAGSAAAQGPMNPSVGRLHLLDGRTLHFTEIRVPRDPDCPVCAHRAHQAR